MKTADEVKARIKALETEREAWIREAKREMTAEGYPQYCREIIHTLKDGIKLLEWVLE